MVCSDIIPFQTTASHSDALQPKGSTAHHPCSGKCKKSCTSKFARPSLLLAQRGALLMLKVHTCASSGTESLRAMPLRNVADLHRLLHLTPQRLLLVGEREDIDWLRSCLEDIAEENILAEFVRPLSQALFAPPTPDAATLEPFKHLLSL